MTRPIPDHDPAQDTVERAAARWFARRRSGEMSEAEAQALEAWLDADPANRLAYDVVARAWSAVGLMRTAPEVLTLRARHRGDGWRPRLADWRTRLAAACLALAVVGASGVWVSSGGLSIFQRFPNQAFRTDLGQRSTVTLPDGSVVTLNTDTVLRTRASPSQRLVYLDHGQAFFRVAHDPSRPFIVTAGGRTVTAVGTAFDVRVEKGRFEVTLVEGKVRVATPVAPPPGASQAAPRVQTSELVAGSQFVAVNDRRWSVDRADTAKETTWLTGWLKFDGDPLGEVVSELGRYSDRRIVLEDPALASVPVSGRFKPEDVDAFVRALETYKIARVDVDSPEEIRLSRYE